mgnify:CR=1 FL=1
MIILVFLTPIKLAFLITIISILVSIECYEATNSIFFSRRVVISFSSGIIIIICYTALISNFESKNKNLRAIVILLALTIIIVTPKKITNVLFKSTTTQPINSILIIFLIFMVIMSIKAINQRLFNPSKSIISSYC